MKVSIFSAQYSNTSKAMIITKTLISSTSRVNWLDGRLVSAMRNREGLKSRLEGLVWHLTSPEVTGPNIL